MEQLYVFGTGNAVATRCYNTCFAIKQNQEYFMVDTGGGNGILKVLEDMNVNIPSIHHIFVSHEHTDHILGIIWLIRAVATRVKKELYKDNLYIYCHRQLVHTIKTISRLTLQEKFYKLIDDRIFIVPLEHGDTKQILDLTITFFDIESTKAKQFGFTAILSNRKKLSFTGDEPYNPACNIYVKDSNWLLHEAFCLHSQKETFHPYEKHHSTVKDACQLGESLQIPNLVLWHTEDKNLSDRKKLYLAEGKPYYSGNLYVPDDKEILDLK